MTERLWVRAPTVETIFQAPFNWIKAWNKICGKTLTWHCCICCNPANGRVDFVEWLAYKIQLHGNEWIVSLSADWDQSPKPKKNKKKNNYNIILLLGEIIFVCYHLVYQFSLCLKVIITLSSFHCIFIKSIEGGFWTPFNLQFFPLVCDHR